MVKKQEKEEDGGNNLKVKGLIYVFILCSMILSVSALSITENEQTIKQEWEDHILTDAQGDKYFLKGTSRTLINESLVDDSNANYSKKSLAKSHNLRFKEDIVQNSYLRIEKQGLLIDYGIERLQYYNLTSNVTINSSLSSALEILNKNGKPKKGKYKNAFTNVDIEHESEVTGVKEIVNVSTKPIGPSIINSLFEVTGSLKVDDYDLFVDGVNKTKTNFTTNSSLDFLTNGITHFKILRPNATDDNAVFINGSLRGEYVNGQMFIHTQINATWMQNAAYPVLIDPTFQEEIIELDENWTITPIETRFENQHNIRAMTIEIKNNQSNPDSQWLTFRNNYTRPDLGDYSSNGFNFLHEINTTCTMTTTEDCRIDWSSAVQNNDAENWQEVFITFAAQETKRFEFAYQKSSSNDTENNSFTDVKLWIEIPQNQSAETALTASEESWIIETACVDYSLRKQRGLLSRLHLKTTCGGTDTPLFEDSNPGIGTFRRTIAGGGGLTDDYEPGDLVWQILEDTSSRVVLQSVGTLENTDTPKNYENVTYVFYDNGDVDFIMETNFSGSETSYDLRWVLARRTSDDSGNSSIQDAFRASNSTSTETMVTGAGTSKVEFSPNVEWVALWNRTNGDGLGVTRQEDFDEYRIISNAESVIGEIFLNSATIGSGGTKRAEFTLSHTGNHYAGIDYKENLYANPVQAVISGSELTLTNPLGIERNLTGNGSAFDFVKFNTTDFKGLRYDGNNSFVENSLYGFADSYVSNSNVWFAVPAQFSASGSQTFQIATDYNDLNWSYRKTINLTNPSSNKQVDVPFTYNLSTDADISANASSSSYEDIRVVDSDGNTLQHEIILANTSVRFIANVSASSTDSVTIFYGNPNAKTVDFHPLDITTGIKNSSLLMHIDFEGSRIHNGNGEFSKSSVAGVYRSSHFAGSKNFGDDHFFGYGGTNNGTGFVATVSYNGTEDNNATRKHDLGTGDYTVEAWFKTSSTANLGYIFSKDDGLDNQMYIHVNSAPGILSCRLRQGGGGTATVDSPGSVADGEWHHVACLRDTTNDYLALYLDGDVVDTDAGVNTINPDSKASTKVSGSGNGMQPFFGELDDVKLWSSIVNETYTDFINNPVTKTAGNQEDAEPGAGPGTCGVSLTSDGLSFGSITIGGSASSEVTNSVSNTGDTSAQIEVSGTNFNDSVSVNRTSFDNVTGAYGIKDVLSITDAPVFPSLNITESLTTYWQIKSITGDAEGAKTQNITYSAVC